MANPFLQFVEEKDEGNPFLKFAPVTEKPVSPPAQPAANVNPFAQYAPGAPAVQPGEEGSFWGEIKKGFGAAWEGIKFMPDALKLQTNAEAIDMHKQLLDAYTQIDTGKEFSPAEASKLKLDYALLRNYQKADPDQRTVIKNTGTQFVGERSQQIREAIPAYAEYQKRLEPYKGRVPDATDIESLKDFRDWLGYNVASGAVQVIPVMAAAYATGGVGAFALGTGMAMQEGIQNRLDFVIDKVKNLSNEEQAQAVQEYLKASGDTTMTVAIASGALDLAGPVGSILKKRLAKELGTEVVKYETKREAAKAALKQAPREMGEEFLTGGAQEIAQIAGERTLGEQTGDVFSKENVKRVFNSAAAEAAGSVAGSGVNVGTSVGRQMVRERAEALAQQEFEKQLQQLQQRTTLKAAPEDIAQTYEALVSRYQAEGMSEVEALKAAGADIAQGGIDLGPMGTGAELEGAEQRTTGGAGVGVSVPQPPTEAPAVTEAGRGRLDVTEGPAGEAVSREGQPAGALTTPQVAATPETPAARTPAVETQPAAETPTAKTPAQDRFSDWQVITQEDDPSPFPEGMEFAVSAGATGTLEFFKTKKEADNWLRQEIEFQKTLTPTAEAPAAKTPAPIAETPATDPIGFARFQALTSFDRRNSSDYSSPEEAIDFGLDNLNDTLTEYRVTDPFIREQAVEAYQNEIARLEKEAAPKTEATATEAATPTEVVPLEDVTVETPTSQLPVNPETGLKPPGKRGRPRIERTPEQQAAAEAQRKERQKVGRDAIRAVEKAQQTIAAPVDVEAIQRLAQTDKAAAVAVITEIQQGRDLALLEAARVLTDKKLSPTAKAKQVANAVFSHPSVTAEERQRAQRNAQLRDTAKNILVEGSTSFYPDSFYETVTDATQAANYISKKGNAFERLLINRIKPFLKGVKVVVVNDPRVDIPDPVARREFRGAAGLYAEGDGQRVIYLNNIGGRREGLTNMTFLHEAVHGATMAQINRFYKDPGSLSPQVVKAIQVLTEVMIRAGDHYNVLKKQGKTDPLEDRLNELEVFDDLKEFVAYGMTQPEMQDFLLKVPGFIQVRADRLNGLTAFVRAIQNMFGLGPQHNSAFQDLIIITDRIMGVDQLPAPTESVEVAAAKKVKAQNKTMEKIAKSQRAADVNAGLGELMMQTRNAKDAIRLLKSVYSALSISAVRKILPTMTTMDITRWVGDKINNIKVVNNAVEDMAGMRTKMIRELAEKTPQWIEFGRKFERGARTLGDVMHASTLLGIDPTQHADLATALRNDAQLKQLRVDYQAAIADPTKSPGQRSKLKGDVTKRENDLKAVYEGGVVQNPYTGEKYQIEGWTQLGKYGNGEGHRVFRMARDSYRDTFDLHQKLLTDKINKSGIPAASKAKLIAEITQGFQEAKQLGVYFPLMRYGNFWLRIGKGKSGEYYMFESAAARNNYARMRAEESGRTLDQALEAQEYDVGDNLDQIRNDIVESSRMLKSIFNALESNSTTDPTTGKVGITDVAAIKDQVYQMFLMTLPDRDMRKRFTHRQGKTGFSADVLRNFIVNQHTAANQLSRLAYADKIRLGIGSAYAELAGNPDKLKLSAFVDEIAMRAGAEMTPAIPNGFDWDKMASIGNQAVFYYMLTSPKSAIVQMTQLPVVGMPALLARYGLADTLKVTARYTNLFDKLGTTKRDQNGNVTTEWGEPSINDSSYVNKHPDPAYRRALRQAWQVAQDRDLFMSTYAADMTARAAVPTAKYQGWMGRGTRATLNFMGGAFHHLERLTREIMYMSTFELEFARAKKAGADDATATARSIKAATDMVYESLFNYSQYNKPRVMKANALTKIATQFMTYPLQMTSYLTRNFFNMLRSLPPQERKEAAIKFFGTMGMTTMFAGVVGLPGYSAILGLVEGLREAFRPDMEDEGADEYYDDDDDSNPLGKRSLDLWFREWLIPTYFGPGSSIAKALGLTESQALTLQRSVKMGPISALTDLNIGASVSLDGLWFRDDEPAQSSKDAFTQFMFNFVMGPFGSMGQQIASAFDDFNNGQFNRGVEKILPAFFRGTAKAIRLASEGEQTRQGAEIRNAEWFTTGKLLGTTLGFQSTEVAEIQKKNFLAKRVVVDVQRERQDTLDALDLALRRYENDPTDANEQRVEKALKEVEQYNYKNGALPIDADTVQKSLEGRAKRRGAAIEGFIAGPKESAIARPILERTQVQ